MTEYAEPKPEYCTQCGNKMIEGRKKPALSRFNSSTGRDRGREEYKLVCTVLNTLWGRVFGGYHDKFIVIDNPHDEIVGGPHRSVLRLTV